MTAPAPAQVLPVVLCTWKRLHRLEETLDLLLAQRNVQPLVHIWNNNPEITGGVKQIVGDDRANVMVHHSPENVGGFGRFYVGRRLAEEGYDRVVFVDDDVTFDADLLERFNAEHRPDRIHSFWAWQFQDPDDYWNRSRIERGSDDPVDYCGTGGMICPTQIFTDDRLFDCPKEFWFIEDLWLSYFATHVLGLKLRRSDNEVVIHKDRFDQALGLLPHKSAMLRTLRREHGWRLASDREGATWGNTRRRNAG